MTLAEYEIDPFTHDGTTRDVYRRGSGPAVLVMAEMPGITPKVVEFADRVVDIGCTAVLPHLFGTPDKPGLDDRGRPDVPYMMKSMLGGCISRDFATFALHRSSPVIEWLRALGRREHERCGGPGIGAIGMCFTGGFALAMATDPSLLAPVLSQPSLPLGIGKARKAAIDCSPEDLAIVKDRCATDGLQVLGMRFTGDPLVPGERFAFLRRELGDAFVAVEIEGKGHSVVTEHLVDMEGHPTMAALGQVLDLFRSKLLVSPS
ncbi:MAG TPA: dienelactone hydrolase family protein [Acidimicrobiales bacterium]|nr:dienelactone hydrolase family protein [Acidimicrobiales bacterium]